MVNRPAFNGSYASLVPQSGAQFLDMELPAEKNERSLVFKFYEEESFADNKNLFSRLFLVEEDENGELIKIDDGERVDPDRVYSVNFKKALELYSGHWMPLPYLRSQGQGFAQGPQLWSRVFITPRDIEDEYDVTLAFDTTVSEDTTGSWATLTPDDRILDLAHQLKSNSFLLHHEWMRDWLHRIYEIGIENRAVHRQRTANEEYAKCAHWAYFLVFLNGLKTRVEVPEIKILDTSNPHLHIKEIDFGEEHQMVLELRPSHDPAKSYGFCGVVVDTTNLQGAIFTWWRDDDGVWQSKKTITIDPVPADTDDLPELLKGFGAVPPLVTDIDLSLDDKYPYVAFWGLGEMHQYDVSDPMNPVLAGKVELGGIVANHKHPNGKEFAFGPQMVEISRDGKRVYWTNSLYST